MKILILSGFLIFTSCKLKVEKGDGVFSTSFSAGGNCHLVEGAQDALCVEYQLGSFSEAQMDADCDDRDTRYAAFNINTHFSSYNPTISCRSGGKVGRCTEGDIRITYYDNEFTSNVAESDCVSLGGDYVDL